MLKRTSFGVISTTISRKSHREFWVIRRLRPSRITPCKQQAYHSRIQWTLQTLVMETNRTTRARHLASIETHKSCSKLDLEKIWSTKLIKIFHEMLWPFITTSKDSRLRASTLLLRLHINLWQQLQKITLMNLMSLCSIRLRRVQWQTITRIPFRIKHRIRVIINWRIHRFNINTE